MTDGEGEKLQTRPGMSAKHGCVPLWTVWRGAKTAKLDP